MENRQVVLIKQSDYSSDSLLCSIRKAIELTSFDLTRVGGATVLLKPNLVTAHRPEEAVTTHPAFVAAVGRVFREAGAEVWVGDCPMGDISFEDVLTATGVGAACREAGLILRDFRTAGVVSRQGFPLSKVIADADFVINLPKFKTHLFTMMTLSVKNLFGCVESNKRADYHRISPRLFSFSETLVKIAEVIAPDLNLVDGIVAMDGYGPTLGDPFPLSAIVASKNIHASDWAACTLIGLNPLHLETLRAAVRLGVWNYSDSVRLTGDPIESMRSIDFTVPYEIDRSWFFQFAKQWWHNRLSPQPQIDRQQCKRCGLCFRSCPAGAIVLNKENFPRLLNRRCIKCYCCTEVCPHHAVLLNEGLLRRVAAWFSH